MREPRRDAWRRLVDAYNLVAWLIDSDLARELDLPRTWYELLAVLGERADHSIELNRLEDALVFSQSGVSQLVSRMERRGLVRRSPHPTDGRRWIVELTAAGADVLQRADAVYQAAVERHFALYLGTDEAHHVAAVLDRVREGARKERERARRSRLARRGAG